MTYHRPGLWALGNAVIGFCLTLLGTITYYASGGETPPGWALVPVVVGTVLTIAGFMIGWYTDDRAIESKKEAP
jgi:peptidoglycan/LPS O-acetylase OafA/YrhL